MPSDTTHNDDVVRTFIWGSCVSRDTFGFLPEQFQLTTYVARQSLISAGNDASAVRSKLTPPSAPPSNSAWCAGTSPVICTAGSSQWATILILYSSISSTSEAVWSTSEMARTPRSSASSGDLAGARRQTVHLRSRSDPTNTLPCGATALPAS